MVKQELHVGHGLIGLSKMFSFKVGEESNTLYSNREEAPCHKAISVDGHQIECGGLAASNPFQANKVSHLRSKFLSATGIGHDHLGFLKRHYNGALCLQVCPPSKDDFLLGRASEAAGVRSGASTSARALASALRMAI